MPRLAEIDVDEWAAPNGSYSLSDALGETAQAAALSQGSDPIAPTGQDLVRISLMADVPDDAIGRRIENVVQRDASVRPRRGRRPR